MRLRTRLAIACVAVAMVMPSPASAQQSEPETGDIGNGTARAAALVARVGPAVGNLELAIRAGLAITQLTNNVAQATGQTLDLGLIGTALTAEGCTGGGLIPASALPKSTDIDNRGGNASKTEDELGAKGQSPVSIGKKTVSAGVEPVRSQAITAPANIQIIPGVIEISVGEATATTEALPGEGRQATATMNLSIRVGALQLTGLEWRAFHRTGAHPVAEGSFSLANVAGLPVLDIPLTQLSALENLINGLTGLLGLRLQFPRVERFLEPTDMIRVTPLHISITDSPVGQALIAPIKTAAQPGLDAVFDSVTDAVCQAAAVPLVGDVVTSVVAGSGSLTLEVGGVEASSGPFVVSNPFGEIPPMIAPPTPTVPPPTQGTIAAAPPTTPLITQPPSSEAAAPPTAPLATHGPLEKFCASIHPNGNSCSTGAALALGLIGILTTVAIAGVEIRKQIPRRKAES